MVTDDVFAVIAEATRRDILVSLQAGDKAVGELVEELAASQPTISKHLKVLREADLVSMRAQGQKRYYALNPKPLAGVANWLETFDVGRAASAVTSPDAATQQAEEAPTGTARAAAAATAGAPAGSPAPAAASPAAASRRSQRCRRGPGRVRGSHRGACRQRGGRRYPRTRAAGERPVESRRRGSRRTGSREHRPGRHRPAADRPHRGPRRDEGRRPAGEPAQVRPQKVDPPTSFCPDNGG
jgi:DNA-binding transcriptional ArsR family regulator